MFEKMLAPSQIFNSVQQCSTEIDICKFGLCILAQAQLVWLARTTVEKNAAGTPAH